MPQLQVPSAEYSSYINSVISLGLAEDYTKQLRASCFPDSPVSLRAAIDQACRHLSGVVDDLQPVPVSTPGDSSLETRIQQDGVPLSEGAMAVTPEQRARMLRCTQIINARHCAAKPPNTVNAERAAAKLWKVEVTLLLLPSVADGRSSCRNHSQPARLQRQGNQPMNGETLNVHLRQAFDLAGEPVHWCCSIWTGLPVTWGQQCGL